MEIGNIIVCLVFLSVLFTLGNNSTELEKANRIKDLGLAFDLELSFKFHCEQNRLANKI